MKGLPRTAAAVLILFDSAQVSPIKNADFLFSPQLKTAALIGKDFDGKKLKTIFHPPNQHKGPFFHKSFWLAQMLHVLLTP